MLMLSFLLLRSFSLSLFQLNVFCPASLGDENMGKFGILSGAMPVFFSLWKQDHVTDGNRSLFMLRCNNPGPCGHDQNLITFVDMELVSDPLSKIDHTHVVIASLGDQRLVSNIFSGKERADSGILWNILDADDMHG